MKAKEDVISDFNKMVNMTASELETWLKSKDSTGAGWPKDHGSGESVGHDSGRKIVKILKHNPKKEAELYTDEDIEHMRKVVAYCKRHLAQETRANNEKTPEEVKKTKSYASLKNWGHDFLKAEGKEASRSDKHSDKSTKPRTRSHESTKPRTRSHESTKPRTRQHEKENDREDNEHEREKPESDENEDAHGDHAGDKRKPSAEKKKPLKRRETRKGHEDEDAHGDHAGDKRKPSAKKEKPTKKRETSKGHEGSESGESESEGGSESGGYELAKGDTVSWKWGGGHPQGKVLDVKGEKTSIRSKNDHEITRKGQPDDPAVVLDTGKSKAIKLSHELD